MQSKKTRTNQRSHQGNLTELKYPRHTSAEDSSAENQCSCYCASGKWCTQRVTLTSSDNPHDHSQKSYSDVSLTNSTLMCFLAAGIAKNAKNC